MTERERTRERALTALRTLYDAWGTATALLADVPKNEQAAVVDASGWGGEIGALLVEDANR